MIIYGKIWYDIQALVIQHTDKIKNLDKWPWVKIHLSKNSTTKEPALSTLNSNNIWRSKMRYITCRPDLFNLKKRKNLISYIIVRIELSINENTKIPQT